MSPFLLHGIERIVIIVGAFGFGVLGYLLFTHRITRGKANLEFSSPLAKVVFSGTGPGLFFMAFGAIIFVICAMNGVVKTRSEVRTYPPTESGTSTALRGDESVTAELTPTKPIPPKFADTSSGGNRVGMTDQIETMEVKGDGSRPLAADPTSLPLILQGRPPRQLGDTFSPRSDGLPSLRYIPEAVPPPK